MISPRLLTGFPFRIISENYFWNFSKDYFLNSPREPQELLLEFFKESIPENFAGHLPEFFYRFLPETFQELLLLFCFLSFVSHLPRGSTKSILLGILSHSSSRILPRRRHGILPWNSLESCDFF